VDRARVVPSDRSHNEPERVRAAPQHRLLRLQQAAGNQAVGRLLSTASRPVLQRMPYIVQAGYMSGDMFGISAALTLNPDCGVLILTEDSAEIAETREPDQGEFFEAFYREALANRRVNARDIDKRVKRIPVTDSHAVYTDLLGGGAEHGRTVKGDATLAARDTFIGPGIATSMVGDEYAANAGNARARVRESWTAGAGPSVAGVGRVLVADHRQIGRASCRERV